MYVCMWLSDSSRSAILAVQERIRAAHSGLAAAVVALQPSIRRFIHTYIHTYIPLLSNFHHKYVWMYVWVPVLVRIIHVSHGTWPNPGGPGGRAGLQESVFEPVQGIPGEIVCICSVHSIFNSYVDVSRTWLPTFVCTYEVCMYSVWIFVCMHVCILTISSCPHRP